MSFKPKKSLGQHFLKDPNMIEKIVNAVEAAKTDRIIEIGPGTGALTQLLLDRFEDVHAIELDERAAVHLKEEFPDLIIHQQDVLKVNWSELKSETGGTHVIGNLPYYITSPILFSLLSNRYLFEDALLMMQKEVAERLVAETRTKAYGILSVQTQLMSSVEILFDVSRHVFSPQPNVDSAMVRLTFDKGKLKCSEKHMKQVVRTAFNQRRKKMSNALKPLIQKYKPENFDLSRRAEELPPEEYEMLTVHLEQNGILT